MEHLVPDCGDVGLSLVAQLMVSCGRHSKRDKLFGFGREDLASFSTYTTFLLHPQMFYPNKWGPISLEIHRISNKRKLIANLSFCTKEILDQTQISSLFVLFIVIYTFENR